MQYGDLTLICSSACEVRVDIFSEHPFHSFRLGDDAINTNLGWPAYIYRKCFDLTKFISSSSKFHYTEGFPFWGGPHFNNLYFEGKLFISSSVFKFVIMHMHIDFLKENLR